MYPVFFPGVPQLHSTHPIPVVSAHMVQYYAAPIYTGPISINVNQLYVTAYSHLPMPVQFAYPAYYPAGNAAAMPCHTPQTQNRPKPAQQQNSSMIDDAIRWIRNVALDSENETSTTLNNHMRIAVSYLRVFLVSPERRDHFLLIMSEILKCSIETLDQVVIDDLLEIIGQFDDSHGKKAVLSVLEAKRTQEKV